MKGIKIDKRRDCLNKCRENFNSYKNVVEKIIYISLVTTGLILLFVTTIYGITTNREYKKINKIELINNTDDNIVISYINSNVIIKDFYKDYNSNYINLAAGDSVEIESSEYTIKVIYPRKYWKYGRINTNNNTNTSIEVNDNSFYVENY